MSVLLLAFSTTAVIGSEERPNRVELMDRTTQFEEYRAGDGIAWVDESGSPRYLLPQACNIALKIASMVSHPAPTIDALASFFTDHLSRYRHH